MPNLSAGPVQCCEPFSAVAMGIDASQVGGLDDFAISIVCMTDDCMFSGEVWAGHPLGEFGPAEELDGLVFQAHLRVVVRVYDEVGIGFVVGEEIGKEVFVVLWDDGQVAAETVAFHGLQAAVIDPAEGFSRSI